MGKVSTTSSFGWLFASRASERHTRQTGHPESTAGADMMCRANLISMRWAGAAAVLSPLTRVSHNTFASLWEQVAAYRPSLGFSANHT